VVVAKREAGRERRAKRVPVGNGGNEGTEKSQHDFSVGFIEEYNG